MNGGNKPLKYALLYGEAGYLVFPCRPGAKMPATRHGLLDASAEVDEIQRMFDDPDFNIGLACGPQPNDRNLLAVDVDAHKGGIESWDELVKQRELGDPPYHHTPNGGMHVFFDAPSEFRNSRERLGQGIDTRASGGYVVVPPSSLFPVDGGQDRPYGATGATALLTNVPPAVPGWLLELLEPQVDLQELSEADLLRGSGPRQDEWESPADWIRRVGDWATELGRFGWSHAHGTYWVRPGKSARDGHSAILHEGGPLVVFSTDVPVELESVGHRTVDGTGFSVSLFELVAAYEFGGDLSACARELRRAMPTTVPVLGQGTGPVVDGTPAGRSEVVSSVLNLPDEFWEARPFLSLIRQAADAQTASADAVLANVLCRSAALVPPSLKLPAIIGAPATLDFLACVVGTTSAGKSNTQGIARELVPDPAAGEEPDDRMVLFDQGIGSGEGIVQAFFKPEMKPDEDGKPKRTNRQTAQRQGLHLVVDEATALIEMAQRKGSTIMQTLVSAWSGATLGQLNASAETRRTIDPGRVRVTAAMNMQSSNAHLLFEGGLSVMGFTSRILFMQARDGTLPPRGKRPEFPGPLPFTPPAGYTTGGKLFVYDEAISDEVIDAHWKVATTGEIDEMRGHSYLVRLKVACLLAVWDSRTDVNLDDWALAGMVTDTSAAILRMLRALRTSQVRDLKHQAAISRGEAEYVAETAKEAKLITDFSLKLVGKVPKDGINRSDLRKAAASGKTRHRFDAALTQALSEGRLVMVGPRIERP